MATLHKPIAMLEGRVRRVYDGDTIKATLHLLPQLRLDVSIRINGIDTPEIRGGKCPDIEKPLAIKAKKRLIELLAENQTSKTHVFYVHNIKRGKYAGRLLADVMTIDGKDVASTLIAEGHGRPYDGGKREGWCS